MNTPNKDNTSQDPPPTKKFLQQLVASGMRATAEKEIAKHKLKLAISTEGIVFSTADDTLSWLERYITVNDYMLSIKQDVLKMAKEDDEVLIQGETGTGKEIIAHALNGERDGKFMAINCAGLPSELVESELFGHLQGSFTGALRSRAGIVQDAGQGTVFLDEIGDLPILAQSKLLRVIQERKSRPVGSVTEQAVQCRFVFATHKDLLAMTKESPATFRDDLYARISTMTVQITPLKERTEDIEPILLSIPDGPAFVTAFKEKLTGITSLSEIETPYNVRTLRQFVRRYKVLGKLPI